MGPVARALTEYFKQPEDFTAPIVFATHQVFPYLPFVANRESWHLLIDEELQVIRHIQHRLLHNHWLITDHIRLEAYDEKYSRVIPTNQKALEFAAKGIDDDELFGLLANANRTLTNENWLTYVDTAQYAKLLKGQTNSISLHSILTPAIVDGFASVLMTAANFTDSLIYQLWGKHHCFVRDDQFAEALRFDRHDNGSLVTIYYAMTQNWSKWRASSKPHDDNSMLDYLIAAAQQTLGDDFIWQGNSSMGDAFDGAERLPNKPHGLNDYAECHRIAFIPALNPFPDHCNFWKRRG